MIKEIALFNGGVNNLVDTHLIAENESPIIIDADIRSGVVSSQRTKEHTATTINGKYGFYYKTKDELITTDEDRFFIEFGGFLYWSNSAGTMKRYNGSVVSDIGNHIQPDTDLTATESTVIGLLDGDYWYTFTYIHEDVFESPPSGYKNITLSKKEANISFTDTPPSTATHRKLYRAGGINPSFNLVATIPIATNSYTDRISDLNISRSELSTYLYDAPPEGMDMIVQMNGTFFGAVGNKVHFSLEGQPEYWSAYNYIQIPQEITGLGTIGSEVVAFTIDSMYIIYGTNLSNISLTKLPFNYGCKNKRTVQNLDGRLLWVSTIDDNDAIMSFDGSSVAILTKNVTGLITPLVGSSSYSNYDAETYLNFDYLIKNSAAVHNKYYLFTNGRTIVIDFLNGGKITYSTDSIDSGYLERGVFKVIESLTEYEYYPDFSKYRSIYYRTKNFVNGMVTQSKSYRVIRVNATGAYTISIFVDEKFIMDVSQAKTYLPQGVTGSNISFLIKSDGYAKVRAISYEYETLK